MSQTGDGTHDGAAERLATDADADPWTRLKHAQSAEPFSAIWLEIHAGLIEGAVRGVVVLGPQGRGPFAPVAVWPSGQPGTPDLAQAVEQCITERKAVNRAGKSSVGDQPAINRFISVPVVVNDNVYGGVAFEIKGDQTGDIIVELHIQVPTSLSKVEEELFKELAGKSTFNPRQEMGQRAAGRSKRVR